MGNSRYLCTGIRKAAFTGLEHTSHCNRRKTGRDKGFSRHAGTDMPFPSDEDCHKISDAKTADTGSTGVAGAYTYVT